MAITLFVCLFNLNVAVIFAQEDASEETLIITESADTPVNGQIDDPRAPESRISLGDDNAATGGDSASTLSILRVLLTLAVVAAAIYGIVFFIKRIGRGNTAPDPFLKIVASTPLGVNRRAYVLSVGSQAWLVGASENGVNLIGEIGDKETLDAMLLEDSRKIAENPAGTRGGPFPDLRALFQKWGGSANLSAPAGPESIRKRRERLKGL